MLGVIASIQRLSFKLVLMTLTLFRGHLAPERIYLISFKVGIAVSAKVTYMD